VAHLDRPAHDRSPQRSKSPGYQYAHCFSLSPSLNVLFSAQFYIFIFVPQQLNNAEFRTSNHRGGQGTMTKDWQRQFKEE
jgi:hypothetical protein